MLKTIATIASFLTLTACNGEKVISSDSVNATAQITESAEITTQLTTCTIRTVDDNACANLKTEVRIQTVKLSSAELSALAVAKEDCADVSSLVTVGSKTILKGVVNMASCTFFYTTILDGKLNRHEVIVVLDASYPLPETGGDIGGDTGGDTGGGGGDIGPECVAHEFDANRVNILSGSLTRGRHMDASAAASTLSFDYDTRRCDMNGNIQIYDSTIVTLKILNAELKAPATGEIMGTVNGGASSAIFRQLIRSADTLTLEQNISMGTDATNPRAVFVFASHIFFAPSAGSGLTGPQAATTHDFTFALIEKSTGNVLESNIKSVNVTAVNFVEYRAMAAARSGGVLTLTSNVETSYWISDDVATINNYLQTGTRIIAQPSAGYIVAHEANGIFSFTGPTQPASLRMSQELCNVYSDMRINFFDGSSGKTYRLNTFAADHVEAERFGVSGSLRCSRMSILASGFYSMPIDMWF